MFCLPLSSEVFLSELAFCVLKLAVLRKRKTRESDRLSLTLALWTVFAELDFFLAQHCAETSVTFWAFIKRDFKLHSFSRFVWSSSHFPSLLRLWGFGSTFWAFSHSISSMLCVSMVFMM